VTKKRMTRRNLPHWYVPGAAHFVTFRLAGTLPREVIDRLQQRKEELLKAKRPRKLTPARFRERVHKQLFADYDRYLDAAQSVRWLHDPRIAALVRRSLYYWHGQKYGLMSYCIMPNHVHVLLLPFDVPATAVTQTHSIEVGECADDDSALAGIMHSVKSYTAHEANRILRRSGPFWQHESYDHWVRDEQELERIVQYIVVNPVRANLVSRAYDWYWCSAHDRFLADGDESGWLCWDGQSVASQSSTSGDACATNA